MNAAPPHPGQSLGHKPPRMLLLAAGFLLLLGSAGAVLAPYLLLHHPLLLVALAPWPRHLILVAPLADFWPFMVVGTGRAFISCALGFALGAHYGASSISFFEQRSQRLGRVAVAMTQAFGRAAHGIVLLFPGPLTAGLAAIGGMRARVALPLLWVGQTAWVYINYRLGHALAEWTRPLLELIRNHVWQATLVCAVAVGLYELRRRQHRTRMSSERAKLLD